ncbi:hypothetical protein F0562_028337 [Nyssa sinensis]|uniref:Uncharacterized protein n=1 Tax=Nyssa sinensis TaxID=561372 RepID=A0A5J5B818_9ASTE|nr:hypothetical protein F0562_028337 [Nyssa sinensis]
MGRTHHLPNQKAEKQWTSFGSSTVLVERTVRLDHIIGKLGADPITEETVASTLRADGAPIYRTHAARIDHAFLSGDYRFLNQIVSSVLAPLEYQDQHMHQDCIFPILECLGRPDQAIEHLDHMVDRIATNQTELHKGLQQITDDADSLLPPDDDTVDGSSPNADTVVTDQPGDTATAE